MRRKDRKTKKVADLRLVFYCDIPISSRTQDTQYCKVSSVLEIKKYIRSYRTFDKRKDTATLLIYQNELGKFEKGLPDYIKIQYAN